MARKRFGAEQIIPRLREAEVEIAQGAAAALAAKKTGVSSGPPDGFEGGRLMFCSAQFSAQFRRPKSSRCQNHKPAIKL